MPGLLTVIPEVIQGVNANSVLGNNTGSAGQCVEMTAAQTRALLGLGTTDSPTFAGATFTGNVLFSSNSSLGDSGGNHIGTSYANVEYIVTGAGVVSWTLSGTSSIISQNSTGGPYMGGTVPYSFVGDTSTGIDTDGSGTLLFIPNANVIEQRNGSNAQLGRWFNTYTDASNNEYLEAGFDTDIAYLRTVANGTGTQRPLYIDCDTNFLVRMAGNTLFNVSAGEIKCYQKLRPQTNNTYDLGTDTYHWKTGYLRDIKLDQGTSDDGFINFAATADADATSAISTLTTSGATTHHIQIEINGTTAWIAASTTDPS